MSDYSELSAVIKLLNRLNRSMAPQKPRRPPPPPGMRYVSQAEYDRVMAERAAAAKAAEQGKVEDADAELRIEVVAEMVAAGIAPHVAANLTNTTAKLLAEGKKYGII